MMGIRIECKQRHCDTHQHGLRVSQIVVTLVADMNNDMVIRMCNRESIVLCFGCPSRVLRIAMDKINHHRWRGSWANWSYESGIVGRVLIVSSLLDRIWVHSWAEWKISMEREPKQNLKWLSVGEKERK